MQTILDFQRSDVNAEAPWRVFVQRRTATTKEIVIRETKSLHSFFGLRRPGFSLALCPFSIRACEFLNRVWRCSVFFKQKRAAHTRGSAK